MTPANSNSTAPNTMPNAVPKMYLADMSVVTPIGNTAQELHNNYQQNAVNFVLSDFYTEQGLQITMGEVDDKQLPSLVKDPTRPKSVYYARLLKLANQALNQLSSPAPLPCLLAMTEQYPSLPKFHPDFAKLLKKQLQQDESKIDWEQFRHYCLGRAGGFALLDLALQSLNANAGQQILVGGIDSYQNTDVIKHLSSRHRLMAEGINGFVPSEGAGFLRLTLNKSEALVKNGGIIAISPPGLSMENGHLYSQKPNRGQGLTAAIKQALQYTDAPVAQVFSCFNGESLSISENSSALLRNKENISEKSTENSLAKSTGDLGAASGIILIANAAEQLFQLGYNQTYLLYTASDQAHRSAVCLQFESLT